MFKKITELLKVRFLVHDGSTKNWKFIVFLFSLAFIMIRNSHSVDEKIYRVSELGKEVRDLRNEFVDTRSKLQNEKLKSTFIKRLDHKGVGFPGKSLKRIVIKTEH